MHPLKVYIQSTCLYKKGRLMSRFAAIEDKHKGSVLNAAYATELGNYIVDSHISAWIYGHSHHITELNTILSLPQPTWLPNGRNSCRTGTATIYSTELRKMTRCDRSMRLSMA